MLKVLREDRSPNTMSINSHNNFPMFDIFKITPNT